MTIPARATVTQRSQIGAESVYGTAVAGSKRLPTLNIMPSPHNEAHTYRQQGTKFPSVVVPNKEWSSAKADGTLSYGELPYVFASLYGQASPVAGAGTSQVWTFAPSNGGIDVPQSYTLQHGDANNAVQTVGNVFTDFTMDFSRSEVKGSGALLGRAFDTGTPLTGLNAPQTATITGTPTGGTFTLTFKGQTTAGIAYNAASSAVQSALQALSSVGSGGILVAGGAGGPYTLTFGGSLANSTQPLLTASGAGLTGGVAPSVAIAAGAGGVTNVENVPIQPGTVTAYLDPTFGAIGTTKLAGLMSAQVALSGRWVPEWLLDASLPSFGVLVEGEPKASAQLMLVADSQAMGLLTQYRAGTIAYLQIVAAGPAIAGGGNYGMTFNLPFEVEKLQEYKDEGGVYAIGFELSPIADPVAAYPMQIVLTNKVSAL